MVTVTPRPVLVGFVPGITVAVSNVVPPATTVFGDAPPVTVGSVGVGGAEMGQTNALTKFARVVVHGAIAPAIAMPWRVHAWVIGQPGHGRADDVELPLAVVLLDGHHVVRGLLRVIDLEVVRGDAVVRSDGDRIRIDRRGGRLVPIDEAPRRPPDPLSAAEPTPW